MERKIILSNEKFYKQMIGKSLYLKSSPSSIGLLESYVREVLDSTGVCQSKYSEILISLTEAVNNAIIHGNKADEQKKVIVKCRGQKTGVAFSIKDEGAGFNHLDVPNPTDERRIECCGGRGVYIMSQLADSINYSDNGSTVEMYFKV